MKIYFKFQSIDFDAYKTNFRFHLTQKQSKNGTQVSDKILPDFIFYICSYIDSYNQVTFFNIFSIFKVKLNEIIC